MGMEIKVDQVLTSAGLTNIIYYQWEYGKIIVHNSIVAESIMKALRESGKFGPMRYNNKESAIEFGTQEDFFSKMVVHKSHYQGDYPLYCKEFETFVIDAKGNQQRNLRIVK